MVGLTERRPLFASDCIATNAMEKNVANKNNHIHPDPARIDAEHYKQELAGCRIALGETTQQLGEAKTSVAKLQASLGNAQLSTLQTEREIAQLKATIQVREAEVKTAREDATAAERLMHETPQGFDRRRVEEAEAGMQKALDKRKELDTKLSALHTDYDHLLMEKRALANKVRSLDFELQTAKEKVEHHDAVVLRLNKTIAAANARIEEQVRATHDVTRALTDAGRRISDHEKALEEAREVAEDAQEKLKSHVVDEAHRIIREGFKTFDLLAEFLRHYAPFSGTLAGDIQMVAGEDWIAMFGPSGLFITCADPRKLREDLAQVNAKPSEKGNGKAHDDESSVEEHPMPATNLTLRAQVRTLLEQRPMTATEIGSALNLSSARAGSIASKLGAKAGHGNQHTGEQHYTLPTIN